MKKPWLVGIFVFVFSLTLSGMVFADDISFGGVCADNTSDGYERCNATLHVGDGVAGGRDDYDFRWAVDWKANNGTTAFFDWGLFTSSGVDSGNDDYLLSHDIGGTNKTQCNNKKIYGINCGIDYNLTEYENSSGTIMSSADIRDPENGEYILGFVYFNPVQ